MENGDGDYLSLPESAAVGGHEESVSPRPRNGKPWKRIMKWIALCLLLGVLIIISIQWIGPFLIRKVLIS